MTVPAQTPPTTATDAGTEYTVLVSTDGNTFTVDAASVVARDSNQAIRQHLDGKTEIDATYVAVPARSWRPQKVKTEIALRFGDAA